MAMGDVNQNRRSIDENYYSRMRFSSANLSVGFGYWKGMLKISISEKDNNTQQGSVPSFTELAYIYLTSTKAKIFKKEIEEFLKDPSKPRGINTGSSDVQGIILIGSREDSTEEVPMYYMMIGKVDVTGNIVESCEFDFNSNYHFGVMLLDMNSPIKISKNYYNTLEIEQLITLLNEFIWTCNGATGYFTADISRYENARRENKIDDMTAVLGIDKKSSGGSYNRGGSSSNYFNNSGAASSQNTNRARSTSTSINEIEDDLL